MAGMVLNASRFCIDNGIMIAQAGLLAYRMGQVTPMDKTACTQRYELDMHEQIPLLT